MTEQQGLNPVQERVNACWNRAARGYDSSAGHGLRSEAERKAWLEILSRVLPPPPADVLDLGTGTGFLAFRAHELGHRVIGLDLAEDMLEVARAAAALPENGPAFERADAVRPPFPPSSFDAVVSRHLLWTLREPESALRTWRRLLRTGGRLIAVDMLQPCVPGPGKAFYTDEVVTQLPFMRCKSVDEVINIIQRAGFVDVARMDLSAVEKVEGPLPETAGRYGIVAVRL